MSGRSGQMAQHVHHRAHKGASASAVSPLRHAPLRKIVRTDEDHGLEIEVLECGHTMRPRSDLIGRTYTARRRCRECGVNMCAGNGHVVIDDGGRRGCPCGTADAAVSHLWGRHRVDVATLIALTLADLAAIHDESHYRNGVGPYVGPDDHRHEEIERGHVKWDVRRRA